MFSSLHLTMLLARNDPIADVKQCARPLPDLTAAPIIHGTNVTLHQFMIYFAAACFGLTTLSSVGLSVLHIRRYTEPQEQRQILRIINMPFFYALFNFLALCFYDQFLYVVPLAGIYEAFAVAALFFLFLEYACPDGQDRDQCFANLPLLDKKGNEVVGSSSLVWYQQTWTMVLQFPFSKLVFTIIQIVTQYYGKYCMNSFAPKYAHLWLFLADLFVIGGALGAAMKFGKRVGAAGLINAHHRASAKAWTFFGIILFQIIQDILFGILNGKLFTPTAKITYNDINFGIPAFMTCVESVIFSLIFHWSYSSSEYQLSERPARRDGAMPAQRTKTLLATWNALNLADVIAGTVVAAQLLFGKVKSRYCSNGAETEIDKIILTANASRQSEV